MTASSTFAEVRRLFDLVCDLPPNTQRERIESETSDPEIIAQVRALLGAQTQSLRRAVVPVEALLNSLPDTELADGDRIGAWRLLRKLGSGGMGAVYLAERADGHFQQQAAIKLLRGYPTVDTLEHLAAERQILAALQHPNIARLLDGGATPSGQPYLVMEFVDGVPIDRYCEDRAVDLPGRLRLFQTVCRAVQAAHQRLIVHCDLKPSNVLVRPDGTPVLLDFGIARALDRGGGAAHAEKGGNFFTPHYASPEQRLGVDISTTSDVYSLGLILFELISGRSPQVGTDERTIAQLETGEYQPSSLVLAGCAWKSRLRGDLDAIVLRATSLKPEARYATAEAMADDIERHLLWQPVQARAQTMAYRYSRLLRRRWPAFIAGTLFLILGAVFTWRVISERDRAVSAEREAQLQAATAEQVSDFLVSVFEVANPEKNSKRDITAREVLDQGTQRIDDELAAQPAVRAHLLDVIARAYSMLGRPQQAADLYQRAIAAWRSPGVADPLAAAETLSKLAVVLSNNNRDPTAETAARESLALRQQHVTTDDPAMADSWNTLGLVLSATGHFVEAEEDFRKSLGIRMQRFGAQSFDVATTLHNIGLMYRSQERYTDSTEYLKRALAIEQAKRSDSNPAVLQTLSDLAKTLTQDGKSDQAIPLLQRILLVRKQTLGDVNDDVANDYNELGSAFHDAGNYAQAAENYRAAMDLYMRMNEAGTRGYALPLNNLAFVYEDTGDYAKAEPLFEASLALRRKLYPSDDPSLARGEHNLAVTLVEENKLDAARPLIEHSLAQRVERLGPDNPDVSRSRLLQADWLRKSGRIGEAQKIVDTLKPLRPKFTPLLNAQYLQMSGRLARARGDHVTALEDFRGTREFMIKGWGEAHPQTAAKSLDFIVELRAAGENAQASALLAKVHPLVEATFAAGSAMRLQLAQLDAQPTSH